VNALMKRTFQLVAPVVVLTVALRVVVLELEKIDCRVAPLGKILFACDMGFFLLPVLLVAAMLVAVIPFMTLAEKRDQIARVCLFLLIPTALNALLRVVDYFLLDCGGDGYVNDESTCVVLFARIVFLSLPTVAAIIFVGTKGVRLLVQEKEGAVV